jgi:hypothetical protein
VLEIQPHADLAEPGSGNCSGFVPLERSVTTPSGILRRIRFVDGAEEIYFERQLDPL